MKSGNLNFLEPSEPLQACNGIALPFTFLTLNIYLVPSWVIRFRISVQTNNIKLSFIHVANSNTSKHTTSPIEGGVNAQFIVRSILNNVWQNPMYFQR
jgi:hypothetical protein